MALFPRGLLWSLNMLKRTLDYLGEEHSILQTYSHGAPFSSKSLLLWWGIIPLKKNNVGRPFITWLFKWSHYFIFYLLTFCSTFKKCFWTWSCKNSRKNFYLPFTWFLVCRLAFYSLCLSLFLSLFSSFLSLFINVASYLPTWLST